MRMGKSVRIVNKDTVGDRYPPPTSGKKVSNKISELGNLG